MSDLWTLRQFPIQEENVLVEASDTPPWPGDGISTSLRIADYGLLVQHVEHYGYGQEKRFDENIVELPDGFCDALQRKAVEIGFEHFRDDYPSPLTSQAWWTIFLRLGTNGMKRVIVQIDPDRNEQEAKEVQQFFELWNMIHLHAPFKRPYLQPTRSKRQLKMDARRQRRSDGKNERHESGPLDSEEGK